MRGVCLKTAVEPRLLNIRFAKARIFLRWFLESRVKTRRIYIAAVEPRLLEIRFAEALIFLRLFLEFRVKTRQI